MNREIKFRAWDSIRKRMFSAEEMGADELQLNPNGRGFFNASSVSPKLSQYFPHMMPLQYTGLKDKNGKEIYEGDIIRSGGDENFVDPISWSGKYAEWWANGLSLWETIDSSDIEVIGNIYENPELWAVQP